ncbi:class I SAM-dependent methyltransferase [Gandjariella thermophila]|uniref:class I SAM-dependent methyltransferase n=1 Tax=Gandjariella thermophila TaxID=1931992 RepID=UPI001CEF7A7E|nr:class I SAM-dependent methyltransferase [Gandjariella thermophila]
MVRPLYKWLRHATTDLLFERRYGVHTADLVYLDELGLGDAERKRYQPTGWLSLVRILRLSEVGPDDVFIDFGCGMGRAVLQAAIRYPFRKVIGVEISEKLIGIARDNLARNTSRLRCKDVSLVCADALDYEIPDDVTVAYFANPFTGSIFNRVIKSLIESVDRAPRTVRVIYANPVEESMLLQTGRFRHVRTARGLRPTREWSRSNSIRMYLLEPENSTVRPVPSADQRLDSRPRS